MRRVAIAAGMLAWMLAGCGGGPGMGSRGAVPVSGNWTFGPATMQLPPVLPPFVGGSLMAQGSQVTGDVLILLLNSACPLTGDLGATLTGTVENSRLKLTSSPWNGGVFTVEGTVASDGRTIAATWSVAGGCAGGDSGSMVASYVPPLTGTWAGTAANAVTGKTSPLTGTTVTFTVQQAATPRGFAFPLAGSITFAPAVCGFMSGKLIQVDDGTAFAPSSIVGDEWTMEAQMDDGQSLAVVAGVADLIQPGEWIAVIGITGGACNGALAQVLLSKK